MKIRLEGVTKIFNTFRAVQDVSLDIESGELVALLGPSGSGKTTLLRMVAGLEYPEDGRIIFGSQDATDIPVRERGLGFVFQHYALFPHMTVADNVAFGMRTARAARRSKAEIAERVRHLLAMMQLDGLGERFPAQISGGQRQRVALARALAVDPKVLLLDEPFGALDANVRRDLRRWLRELHAELGITTLFVTHDQEEALDLADRVVILDKGRIVQHGSPSEVTRNPNSAFVMRFLGDTHTIAGTVRDGRIAVGDVIVGADGLPDGRAEIFVRPADLAWSGDGPGIAATIARVIDRPGSRRIVATLAQGETVELDVAPEQDVAKGQTGSLTLLRSRAFPVS